MRAAFLTLGCKVNACETERMKEQFKEAGYQIVAFSEQADVYIVNTCTVTSIADRKSRKMLHRARRMNPEAIVVAAGCYAASAGDAREEGVDLYLDNQSKINMLEAVEQLWHKKLANRETAFKKADCSFPTIESQQRGAVGTGEHTRAFLSIQSGCNQYCSYCIIPYVRGPLVSRTNEEIVEEARRKATLGIKEIVLTGIHISSYGADRLTEKPDANTFVALEGAPLAELLEQLDQIPGIERLRLGSLEPRIITESFVRRISQLTSLCPHFHLSLQSGCDAVLKRMNRHYTTEEYLRGLALLRAWFDTPAITTDIIVGFPGETEEEFEETCRFAQQAAFADIHVFKYSKRQGTIAASLEGQVDEQIKNIRSESFLRIKQQLTEGFQEHFLGTKQRVLLEEELEIEGKTYMTGYTERYVRAAVPVLQLMEQSPAEIRENHSAFEEPEIENPPAATKEKVACRRWQNHFVEVTIAGRLSGGYVFGTIRN